MMTNESLLAKKQREMGFLHHFHHLGYDLIDLGVVEKFEWTQLSHDDLHLMLNRHKWQSGDKLFALRSDWTNAIVRYRKQYHLRADKIAYSGPVYSLLKSATNWVWKHLPTRFRSKSRFWAI